ncbi:Uma2 family endonuclease [Roseiflexus sp.]|uniref:Uma2 family endonuclease n=1 Tax=Roseiflexus sp. TaxID=2562120 RepID=UPI00398A8E0E
MREQRVKLEMTGGVPTWRLLPSVRHQQAIDRIRATITPMSDASGGCSCYHLADVSLVFPDGSHRRPDIAIFCVEPPDIDESWECVPEAVIEMVSPGYTEKDRSMNPPWHLAQGGKDVLVVELRDRRVQHFSHGRPPATHPWHDTAELHCGRRVPI